MTLNQTTDLLESQSYPLTADELTDRHGDHELTLPNGDESLGAVIERSGEESFESAFEAQQAVYASLTSKAIGRKGYSDRDPTPMGVYGPDPVSF
ncbi:Uncharacterized protein HSRCO_2777 [Halanaeroarchaeum sp. HSR-CO]|uniref:DUF5789 family protein n=1 Tax=Halanaeroarchaeum sp. HSR-CO TaxID=2866382 RepID=UPI00217DCBEB|nr:DUF2795 domain-containing protein [Halanaeroarchaeum sp. HSR-CO]UWG49033.1 Uncharacterized protein HSRCO_2777 [Halanaeroarchaeum sp. HSR-CO]